MISDSPFSKGSGGNVCKVKKAATRCSSILPKSCMSTGMSQGKSSMKIHKAEREKLKRDHLNELFQELGRALDPSGKNNCKASLLGDAARVLRCLLAELEKLRGEHASLLSEASYVTLEKDELRDENVALESEIAMLQNELTPRIQLSKSTGGARVPLGITSSQPHHHHHSVLILPHEKCYPHGDSSPAPAVQRPHARYPSSSDSWPVHLLSVLPRTS